MGELDKTVVLLQIIRQYLLDGWLFYRNTGARLEHRERVEIIHPNTTLLLNIHDLYMEYKMTR